MTLFYIIRRLERQHLLDPDSEEDLFCLHHIFLPVIQTFLDEFVGSWNRHGIRTVRKSIPFKIIYSGVKSFAAKGGTKEYPIHRAGTGRPISISSFLPYLRFKNALFHLSRILIIMRSYQILPMLETK
jgi:hypothetical protein